MPSPTLLAEFSRPKIAAVGGPSHSVGPALGGSLLPTQLWDMASRVIVLPSRRGLFLQLRWGERMPAGPLPWNVGAFEIPGSLPGSSDPSASRARPSFPGRGVASGHSSAWHGTPSPVSFARGIAGPWAVPMQTHLGRILGRDSIGTAAMTLVQSSLNQSSYATYSTGLKRFLDFCSCEGTDPLTAGTGTVVRYIAYLGQQGTVAAGSLQPYPSAIHRWRRDLGAPAVAMGPLVTAAREGLARSPPT